MDIIAVPNATATDFDCTFIVATWMILPIGVNTWTAAGTTYFFNDGSGQECRLYLKD